MAYTSGQQRAISHRDWSRKKAPISRVGSYDFNGTVDRATMKMHMAAADRPMSTHARVLTLWPLSSTAIDKTECFAVREREVLWTMRAGKGMGRTTDGRMKALSSLNYFRLVLEDWQLEQLKGIIGHAVTGTFTGKKKDNETAMRILTALVGDNRMNDEVAQKIKIDDLNKIDEHLRHYVLANIQYAGVVITGEEPGSRQSLQGIAVTVGGLNTLANNSDKTLCPGMKLCMTVPRCVPDSTQWPAPCDHIGLPHGKVTPILRQADAQDLTQTILGGTHHIHTQVARMMSGCGGYASADEMKDCKAPVDVYFAFTSSPNNPHITDLSSDYSVIGTIVPNIKDDQLDVMRRINDAVTFTMHQGDATLPHWENSKGVPYTEAMHDMDDLIFSTTDDTVVQNDSGMEKGTPTGGDSQVFPLHNEVQAMWRLMVIAFGNIRDIVLATAQARSNRPNLKNVQESLVLAGVGDDVNPTIRSLFARSGMLPEATAVKDELEKSIDATAANTLATKYADALVANTGGVETSRQFRRKDSSSPKLYPLNYDATKKQIQYITTDDGLKSVFKKHFGDKVPHRLADINNPHNTDDPDASNYAAMIVDVMDKVYEHFCNNRIYLCDTGTGTTYAPNRVVYKTMQAVANGNASFALGVKQNIDAAGNDPLNYEQGFQPNIVVLNDTLELPWDNDNVDMVLSADGLHSKIAIIFRKTFMAPLRYSDDKDKSHIELSDSELPFVGAWVAIAEGYRTVSDTPYRSQYLPNKFLVKTTAQAKYYYLTWSAIVHLVCHNVLQQHAKAKKVLEMNRAELVTNPHYSYEKDRLQPTLINKSRSTSRKFGAPGLGSYLQAILNPDTNNTTKYQDYLRKHSPIASLVNSVIRATVEAVTQHQLATDKKTIGMALSSAGRGEAVDVCLTGAV